jgi:hypothetical protein
MAIYIIRGFLHPWKIHPDMFSEGNAAHPVRCDSPLQIVMPVWRPFCLNSNFLGRVWQPSVDNNGAPKGHYSTICRGLSHPTRSLRRKFAEGRSALQAEKALWCMISRPILDLGYFLKPMSPQDTGTQLWGIPGIISLKVHKNEKFFDFDFEFCPISLLVMSKY